jgi:hypothetical protein
MRTGQYAAGSPFGTQSKQAERAPDSAGTPITAAHPDQKPMGGRRLCGSGDSENEGERRDYGATKEGDVDVVSIK